MKGINLKRIGAIVAGATILASSVAFAGALYYGDTVLVTDSGQPVVKVVVGADAAASDGVAAANIAAAIAREAYKVDTYTAAVGDVSCEAAEGGSTCTISDKSVTLEVTVPGATVTGSDTINTLVGDVIDRTLLDRGASTVNSYSLSGTETSSLANPLANGAGSVFSTALPSATYIYKVTGSDFEPMEDYTVEDEDASITYTETQNFWMGSTSSAGSDNNVQYYESADNLALRLPYVFYTIKFTESSSSGIPVCSQAENSTLYKACIESGSTLGTTYATETHKVKVRFLGEEWIISDMAPGSISATSATTVYNGGYIKLAKESVQDKLNKGEYLTVGDLKFVLDDVALATGSSNVHAAIVSVYAEGVEEALKKAQIDPATTQDVSVPGYGTFKIHVYSTAPGYTFGATWADVAVFSNELKLSDGSDLDADMAKNDHWKVALGWKNRGAGATGDDNYADHLRSIVIWSDEVSDLYETDYWTPGKSIPVVQDPANWKLTFSGLNIDDTDRNSLTFTLETSTTKELAINASYKCNLTAPYIKVKAPDANKFTLSSAGDPQLAAAGTSQTGYNYEAYIAVAPATGGGTSSAIVCPAGGYFETGSVAMKTGTSSTDYYVIYNNTGTTGDYFDWDYAGAGGTFAYGGTIRVFQDRTHMNITQGGLDTNSFVSDTKTWMGIGVSEEAGVGESVNKPAKFVFGVNYSGSSGGSSTFNYDGYPNTDYFKKDRVYVIHPSPWIASNATVEEGYISDRGSKFLSLDDKEAKFSIADEVAYAQIVLATSEAAEAAPNTVTLSDMAEGDVEDISGTDVSVKVVEIKATGTCASGAGAVPTCTVSGEATAYLEDSSGADVGDTLEAATMYAGALNLVVLDSDVTAGTLISVGGPAVNEVTADAQAEGDLALEADGDTVVTQVGNTIVVAGYTAEDTLAAVDEFLAALE